MYSIEERRLSQLNPENYRDQIFKAVAFGIAAILISASIHYIFHSAPVSFTRLISEDQWGEYATSVAWAFCALFSLMAAIRTRGRFQRISWLLISLGALFVGGEEISWGQRIFGLRTPQFLSEWNTQNELTVHNLYLFNAGFLRDLAVLLVCLVSLLVSVLAAIGPTKYRSRFNKPGFPLVPVYLFPLFLLPVYFWWSTPVIRYDEIGELLLGFAMFTFALNQCLPLKLGKSANWKQSVAMTFLMTLMILGIAVILPQLASASSWRWTLNHTAAHSYPAAKMFDQSREVFEFIYTNPHYVQPDTRIRHGRMLLDAGRKQLADEVLNQAITELEATEPKNSEKWLLIGVAHALLGKESDASLALSMSMKTFHLELLDRPDAEEDVEILWWQARTALTRGDVDLALDVARSARGKAVSQKLQRELGRWIAVATSNDYYSPWHYYFWIEFTSRDL
jgi:hypothetical protein